MKSSPPRTLHAARLALLLLLVLGSTTIPSSCAAPQGEPGPASPVEGEGVSKGKGEGVGREPARRHEVPRREAGIIYFLLTDRFVNGSTDNDVSDECFDLSEPNLFHGGDLQGLLSRLDYLEALGVTDVWVTPLQRQVGPGAVPPELGRQCAFHGYWAALDEPDDGALEPRFGGEDALRALLEGLHRRGMRLIVDYVVNHAGYGAPIVTKRPEWFHAEQGCGSSGEPDETCPLLHLPDFAHEREDVSRYLRGTARAFLERFPVDGIRMDTVKHVPLDFFRDAWIPEALAARSELFLLGELFDEGEYERQVAYLDAGFHSLFDFRLRRALLETFGLGASLNVVAQTVADAHRVLGPARARLRVTMLDNHDVPRFASQMRAEPAAQQQERYALALGVLFTTPGIPQVQYGNELGMMGFWPENRRDMPAWAFDAATRGPRDGYLGDPGRNHEVVRRLAQTRRRLRALSAGDYVELWRPGGLPHAVYAFLRTTGDSRALVVLHAGDDALRDLHVPIATNPFVSVTDKEALSGPATLVDALGLAPESRGRLDRGDLVIDLPPRSMAVFILDGEGTP